MAYRHSEYLHLAQPGVGGTHGSIKLAMISQQAGSALSC